HRQVHEITVPIESALDKPEAMQDILAAFDRIYEHRFGKGAGSPSAVVEITTCHLQLVRVLPKVEIAVRNPKGPLRSVGCRKLYLNDWIEVPVYRWEELPIGSEFAGPALVDAPGTTVWVGPQHRVHVDPFGNLRLEAIS